ncbi:TlpA disulfide reductase family protein [Domibacillus sp. 8LH]|uniref:TlpA family protein disulfide reductase n=1 Tax=Domibacillus sp. 8LH TaxID=3073900 RepID=UPI00317CA254
MKEKVILLLLALSIGLFFFDQYAGKPKSPINKESSQTTEQIKTGTEHGQKALDFGLKTRENQNIKLSDYKGKNVFVNFWASWCPPCRAEMPHIQDFYEEYKGKDVAVLSVNLTHLDKDLDTIHQFVQKNGLTFPVIYDERRIVNDLYKVNTIPTSYVVDKDGVIRERIVGPVSKERLEKLFSHLPN